MKQIVSELGSSIVVSPLVHCTCLTDDERRSISVAPNYGVVQSCHSILSMLQLCEQVSQLDCIRLSSCTSSHNRIIDPITSRCAKFRFKPLDREIARKKLQQICDEEKIEFAADALNFVIEESDGDLRRAMTLVQTAARVNAQPDETPKPIELSDVEQVLGVSVKVGDHDSLPSHFSMCRPFQTRWLSSY